MNTLMVMLGAAIGAPARFLVDQYFRKFTDKPIGTFTVNILGSFFIGLAYSSTERFYDFAAIGFAGAFTTWSTFIIDIFLGYELKRYKAVAINLTASIFFGVIAAYLGYLLAS
ncbi:CrcB Integral membrane protein possibly involved in chromosome condensation [Candidatus Nanopelagicaceae bacterium]